MGFLTVADIKRQLNMTGATDDSELSVYAAAASEIVEQWCGPMTLQTIIGELVYGTGSGFVLRNVPVITFTGITYSGPDRKSVV